MALQTKNMGMENNSADIDASRFPIDWRRIRAAYLAGAKTGQITKDFGVNYNTLRMRIQREGWRVDRDLGHSQGKKLAKLALERKLETVQQAVQAAANKAIDEWKEKSVGIAERIRTEVGDRVNPDTSSRDLKELATTLDVVDRVGRRGMGLDDGVQEGAGGRISIGVRMELIGGPGQPDQPTITLEPCGSGGQD